MDLKPGATHEITWTVTPDKTADAMGNRGVKVFATPWLIGMLEDVCGAMIKPTLPPGATTVGTMVEMRHLAATPVGMTARAKATLLQTDGRRFLFSVDAWHAKDESADTSALLRELGTAISRVLHGEQEFEIHRPLQPGRTYLCRAKVVDIYEKAGKSGPMAFVVRETTVTDGADEIVGTMRAVTVVRL